MKTSKWRGIDLSIFSGSTTDLLHPPAGQIPFLDGLRSIAVLLVVSAHMSGRFSDAHGPNFYSKLPFVANGAVGVDLFFVLSGFLITRILIRERMIHSKINLMAFYQRRALRIFPIYYLSLLVCLAIFPSNWGETDSLIFYFFNY